MTKNVLAPLALAVLINCNDHQKKKQTYEAYFYDTHWQLHLVDSSQFVYSSEGHLGGNKVEGSYVINQDTIILLTEELESNKFLMYDENCIVDIETRFDYCEKWPETWGSQKRIINYPQIQPTDSTLKKK